MLRRNHATLLKPLFTRSAWTASSDVVNKKQVTETVLPGTRTAVRIVDPMKILSDELGSLRSSLRELLGSKHAVVDSISKYYFSSEGKHVRPTVIMLMSQATAGISPLYPQLVADAEERQTLGMDHGLDEPMTSPKILTDDNPDMWARARAFAGFGGGKMIPRPARPTESLLLPTQIRLAEITEIIHVASLIHDDVVDGAESRRGITSAPAAFGNKLSVLAGDFLLARASLALSRLGCNEVMELVAAVLANLVEGEVMQLRGNKPETSRSSSLTPEIFNYYMHKTYLKTASLISKTTRGAAVLSGCGARQGWAAGEPVLDTAYEYGRNLGLAFQLIDDMLDFTATAEELGKPGGGADLSLGLATAPALYAWEEFPELGAMIERKFSAPGDVDEARNIILKSSGTQRTFELAEQHSKAAIAALQGLPESPARSALEQLAEGTLRRKK